MQFIFEQCRDDFSGRFSYLIGDRSAKVGAIVDPDPRSEILVERALQQGLQIRYILYTHHHNEIHSNDSIIKKAGTKVAAYHSSPLLPDIKLEDAHTLSLGAISLEILWTPGQSQDDICLYLPAYEVALTGNTLLVGQVGATVTEEATQRQYRSLQRLVNALPLTTTLWPARDVGCRPSSTLAWEKTTNPFLLAKDFPSFLMLKVSWLTYKAQHGLR